MAKMTLFEIAMDMVDRVPVPNCIIQEEEDCLILNDYLIVTKGSRLGYGIKSYGFESIYQIWDSRIEDFVYECRSAVVTVGKAFALVEPVTDATN